MARSRAATIISWLFALFSVAAVWQSDFPSYISNLVASAGIPRSTSTYDIAVGAGIALTFGLVTWLAIWIHDHVLWRWIPFFGCKRGWWIYGLTPHTGQQTDEQVIGMFYLHHTPDGAAIRQGLAYYYRLSGEIEDRGVWHSEVVWISHDVRHVFTMYNHNPARNESPGRYEGYMALTPYSIRPTLGIKCWIGHFEDLEERRGTAGKVYAERLSPWRRWDVEKLQGLLRSRGQEVLEKVPRRATEAENVAS